jgi:hypothetical protein
MALQTSGAISLNDIHIEAGGSSGTQVSMNDSDIRGLIGKASGVSMSFSEWYGAASTAVGVITIAANQFSYGYSAGVSGVLAYGSVSPSPFYFKGTQIIQAVYNEVSVKGSPTTYKFILILAGHVSTSLITSVSETALGTLSGVTGVQVSSGSTARTNWTFDLASTPSGWKTTGATKTVTIS